MLKDNILIKKPNEAATEALTDSEQLNRIAKQLETINRNLLNVFWIVGFFAFLYFGLMLYFMFLK
jgi:hypothetical protein